MINDIFGLTCDNFSIYYLKELYCTWRRIKKVKRKTVLGLYFPHNKNQILTSIAKRQLVLQISIE